MQQRASLLRSRFIVHRDRNHIVRVWDVIWNKEELATDPSDLLDRCVKNIIPWRVLFQVHGFGTDQREGNDFLSPFFRLDPALDRFLDLSVHFQTG